MDHGYELGHARFELNLFLLLHYLFNRPSFFTKTLDAIINIDILLAGPFTVSGLKLRIYLDPGGYRTAVATFHLYNL